MIDQVFILVGGKGSRISKVTKKTPKPLIKINKKIFLDYLISYFTKFGIKKIYLLTNYKNKIFKEKYEKKRISGSNIFCINETQFLGTSGSIKNAIKIAKGHFILCNGDTYFDINLLDFIKKFNKNLIGQLACSSLQNSDNKRYTSFSSQNQKIVSSGLYLFNKDRINKFLLNKGSLENEVIKKLPTKKFKKIIYKKKFIDIGTYADLKKAGQFLKKTFRKKCIFLDRDGVINYDYGYVFKKNNFKWKKNVKKAIKFLNDNNYFVIVISNQSGIGRGFYKEKHVEKLHTWINSQLNLSGAYIDKFYYSPFYRYSKNKKYKSGYSSRKPNTGMFKSACKDFEIIKNKSYFVGDKDTDRLAAKNFNIKYINVDNKTDLYSLLKKKLKNNL